MQTRYLLVNFQAQGPDRTILHFTFSVRDKGGMEHINQMCLAKGPCGPGPLTRSCLKVNSEAWFISTSWISTPYVMVSDCHSSSARASLGHSSAAITPQPCLRLTGCGDDACGSAWRGGGVLEGLGGVAEEGAGPMLPLRVPSRSHRQSLLCLRAYP